MEGRELFKFVALTALSANYLPNNTFHSFADYAALVVSVFGSTTIVGIVGVAALWRRADAWRG